MEPQLDPPPGDHQEEIVVFNIGGEIFETFRKTLRKDNSSVLCDDRFLRKYYRQKGGVYFFDRDPDIFRVSILEPKIAMHPKWFTRYSRPHLILL